MSEPRDNKWEEIQSYEKLRDKFRKDKAGDINRLARIEVVKELRRLADHIESNRSPYLYTYNVKVFDKTLTETTVCLSLPWGG